MSPASSVQGAAWGSVSASTGRREWSFCQGQSLQRPPRVGISRLGLGRESSAGGPAKRADGPGRRAAARVLLGAASRSPGALKPPAAGRPWSAGAGAAGASSPIVLAGGDRGARSGRGRRWARGAGLCAPPGRFRRPRLRFRSLPPYTPGERPPKYIRRPPFVIASFPPFCIRLC